MIYIYVHYICVYVYIYISAIRSLHVRISPVGSVSLQNPDKDMCLPIQTAMESLVQRYTRNCMTQDYTLFESCVDITPSVWNVLYLVD